MSSAAQILNPKQSWFVEASAGTGKTHKLVNAIVDAIAGGTRVDAIVAVTFTNIAAGQMKLRVRHELEQRRVAELDSAKRDLLATAARELDRAFIGTIHSFCGQLLRRRPVEAGVDPVFRELAQPDAMRVFGRVFRRWIEQRLMAPSPAMGRALTRLSRREDSNGEPLDDLRRAAWSLAEWRDFDRAWERKPFDRDGELNSLLTMAQSTLELRNHCGRSYDILHAGLQPLAELVEQVHLAKNAGNYDGDVIESNYLGLPWRMKWLKPGSGQYGQGVSRERIVASWKELEKAIEDFQRRANADLASSLRDELWEVVGLYQEEKKRAGALDFMDLLIQARVLLRDDIARDYFQNTYRNIFVDEFQDTDPLQAEILLLLATGDPGQRDWHHAQPSPGKLYVVGDPKQSIYRFRRADARLYRRIRNQLKDSVSSDFLKKSWRSNTSIQNFVNGAFEPQIEEYLSIEDGVPAREGQPAIVALPMPEPYGTRNLSNARIEECSPNAVAAFIQWLVSDDCKWLIRDPSSERPSWIPIEAKHICILFRRFTNRGTDLTQEYVRCLEARGLRHVLVGSKSFHQREEVGTIRVALKAIEWPDDELSVFATLRGSLFAVTDATLLKFRNSYKRFHPMMELPSSIDPEFVPICEAFTLLTELHRNRNYRPIADTINQLLEGVRAHVGFAFRKGGERVIANVYRLTDLARSYEVSDAGTSFRAFVEHLEDEYQGSDASEAPVLEQEGTGVNLMTVHRAKGLEFPVVILADMTAKLTRSQSEPDRYCDVDRRLCAQRLLGWGPWELLDPAIARDELEAEREEAIRVAYVAATRARDLLVVSVIGEDQRDGGWLSPLQDSLYPPKDRWRLPGRAPGCPAFGSTTVLNRPPDQQEEVSIKPGLHYPKVGNQEVVWFDPKVLQLRVDSAEGTENEQILTGTSEQALNGLQRYNEWRDRRQSRNQKGAVPTERIVTAETQDRIRGAEGIPVQIVTLPAHPGRPSGKTFGRVVHDILQYAVVKHDLESLKSLAEVFGRKHGASELECTAAAETAHAAFQYPSLLAPAGTRQYREFPVLVRLEDGRLVDGRVDLAWSDGKTWTVIDYKTDRRDRRTSAQLQIYGLAIHLATGLPVNAVLLEL